MVQLPIPLGQDPALPAPIPIGQINFGASELNGMWQVLSNGALVPTAQNSTPNIGTAVNRVGTVYATFIDSTGGSSGGSNPLLGLWEVVTQGYFEPTTTNTAPWIAAQFYGLGGNNPDFNTIPGLFLTPPTNVVLTYIGQNVGLLLGGTTTPTSVIELRASTIDFRLPDFAAAAAVTYLTFTPSSVVPAAGASNPNSYSYATQSDGSGAFSSFLPDPTVYLSYGSNFNNAFIWSPNASSAALGSLPANFIIAWADIIAFRFPQVAGRPQENYLTFAAAAILPVSTQSIGIINLGSATNRFNTLFGITLNASTNIVSPQYSLNTVPSLLIGSSGETKLQGPGGATPYLSLFPTEIRIGTPADIAFRGPGDAVFLTFTNASVLPAANGTYNIGSSTNRIGTLFAVNLDLTNAPPFGATTINGTLTVNGEVIANEVIANGSISTLEGFNTAIFTYPSIAVGATQTVSITLPTGEAGVCYLISETTNIPTTTAVGLGFLYSMIANVDSTLGTTWSLIQLNNQLATNQVPPNVVGGVLQLVNNGSSPALVNLRILRIG